MVYLLADIGGTNARFCWLQKGKLGKVFEYHCDDFKTVYEVIKKALEDFPKDLKGIVLAGAGPVFGEKLQWTNRPEWKISKNELKRRYHIKNVMILNDVQAQGEGLRTLYKCKETSILMTAGTGLGGCFIIDGKVIPGEVGQIKTESGKRVEDFISGHGIVYLYHLLGGDKKLKSARKIDELRGKKDKIAQLAYHHFYQKWGEFSGRLVTALYAKGGVYLWGGLIPKNIKDRKILLDSYKKALPKMCSKISLRLIQDKMLAFKGLKSVSIREFGQS